ncbi:uncharacterized protein N7496_003613 [Penicillium cataractarum]|uniref:Uncharacterized protein n=1 Tax=Penicillium cataractarum TaxID=2100454 RepID=A0A9W9SMJ1_9EURO|nr:uncharacterized protein N7496_003613 [Penicillium cataractarum]KAJ5381185.1 hypothetical protein N7496_003613 [Penicillium cataractarum]
MTLTVWDAIYSFLLAFPFLLPALVLLHLLPSQHLFIWTLFALIFLSLSLCFVVVVFFLAGLRFFSALTSLASHYELSSRSEPVDAKDHVGSKETPSQPRRASKEPPSVKKSPKRDTRRGSLPHLVTVQPSDW